MNLSIENVEKIRVWLKVLTYFYEDEAKNPISEALQEHCLVEARKIKAFIEQNCQ